jgi:hypothetical protein
MGLQNAYFLGIDQLAMNAQHIVVDATVQKILHILMYEALDTLQILSNGQKII